MLNAQIFRTNVVLAAFSSYMYIEKAAQTKFVQKNCAFNFDEIDGCSFLSLSINKLSFLVITEQLFSLEIKVIKSFLENRQVIFDLLARGAFDKVKQRFFFNKEKKSFEGYIFW